MNALHVRVRVSGEEYALPVDHVLEVAELGEVAPVPGSPNAVLGVRNMRGQVLPVVDLAIVFGLVRTDPPERIVVTERSGAGVALAVDSVVGVEQLPEAAEEVDSPHLVGAALVDGSLVGVVDVESVLAGAQGVPAA